jgi:hypothetical protein
MQHRITAALIWLAIACFFLAGIAGATNKKMTYVVIGYDGGPPSDTEEWTLRVPGWPDDDFRHVITIQGYLGCIGQRPWNGKDKIEIQVGD